LSNATTGRLDDNSIIDSSGWGQFNYHFGGVETFLKIDFFTLVGWSKNLYSYS
jgi:hypothetical protein